MRNLLQSTAVIAVMIFAGPVMAQNQNDGARGGATVDGSGPTGAAAPGEPTGGIVGGTPNVGGTTGAGKTNMPLTTGADSTGADSMGAGKAGMKADPMAKPGTETMPMAYDSTKRAGGMEEPPPRANTRGPCFMAAWNFDQKLKPLLSDMKGTSESVSKATQMRNEGMEACNAGRTADGRDKIMQAINALN